MKAVPKYILNISMLFFIFSSNAIIAKNEGKPTPLVEIPIEIIANRVQLTVPIEHYTLTFALDTGATQTVIFQSDRYNFSDLPSVGEATVAFPALD